MNASLKIIAIALACWCGGASAQEGDKKSESRESNGTSSSKDDRPRQPGEMVPILWDRLDSKRIMQERRERELKREISKLP